MLQTPTSKASTAPKIAETLNNSLNLSLLQKIYIYYSIPDMPESPYPLIADINITAPGVYKLLSELDPYNASSPDNISRYFLKYTASEISPVLTHTVYFNNLCLLVMFHHSGRWLTLLLYTNLVANQILRIIDQSH